MKAIGLGQIELMMKGYIPAPSSAGLSCRISVPWKGSCCFCPGFHSGFGEDTDLQTQCWYDQCYLLNQVRRG